LNIDLYESEKVVSFSAADKTPEKIKIRKIKTGRIQ